YALKLSVWIGYKMQTMRHIASICIELSILSIAFRLLVASSPSPIICSIFRHMASGFLLGSCEYVLTSYRLTAATIFPDMIRHVAFALWRRQRRISTLFIGILSNMRSEGHATARSTGITAKKPIDWGS
ncbi:hypothetical protein KI387_014186, partial [Taxus chinensis]